MEKNERIVDELNPTTDIINKVIKEINNGKEKIANIITGISDDIELKKLELLKIKEKINNVIDEVEQLEKDDKIMRKRLAEATKINNSICEQKIKEIYEEALEVRVNYITKQSQENELRQRRDELELTLKVHIKNLEHADGMIKQINIALGYLQGDIIAALDGFEEDTRGIIGIKILEMQEKERRRIAKDVHDGPAQYIASTLMKMDFCKMLLQKDLERGLSELDDLKINVKTSLKEIREILFDLRPLSLQEKTLSEAIKEMVKHILREYEIDIQIDVDDYDADIDYIKKVAIYRIVQEIVNNVKKHSKATKIFIKIENCLNNINLLIKDNGIGFDYEEVLKYIQKNGESFGLVGIQDRIQGLQGELNLRTSSMEGTIYKIVVPIRGGQNDKNSNCR